jgi:hypothetical protein
MGAEVPEGFIWLKVSVRGFDSLVNILFYVVIFAGYLTSSQGLCNIGEWHSHHTLGLAEPSYGDQQTVWNHISTVAGGRFLVFIANIRGTAS